MLQLGYSCVCSFLWHFKEEGIPAECVINEEIVLLAGGKKSVAISSQGPFERILLSVDSLSQVLQNCQAICSTVRYLAGHPLRVSW